MFGLDTIKVVIVGALVTALVTLGVVVYHGIQAAEAAKIELQQAKLVAAAQKAQDQRNIEALQTQAAQAAAQAARSAQLVEALHAAPLTTVCLATPAGRAFIAWMHDSGRVPGPAGKAPAKPLAVSGPTPASK